MARRHGLRRRYGRARSGPVDTHAADELELYADNTYALHNQKMSIVANIQRRLKSGKYDHSKAPKLWMYWVDAAARMYSKEFPGTTFNKATREHVAKGLADEEIGKIKRGEYT